MKKPPPRRSAPAPNILALATAIQKEFGSASVSVPADEANFMLNKIPAWIPLEKLNQIFGNGNQGIPCGYFSEVAGPESVGKSTVGYWLLGQAQKAGAIACLADVENTYLPAWGAKQGIDNKSLLYIESVYPTDKGFKIEHVDEQFKKWDFTIRKAHEMFGVPILLLVDSLAALLPKEWLEGDYGERGVARLAAAMAMNLPKLQPVLIETRTACIFVNQLRDKIGVMFGERETTTGGRAKNFYFMTRVAVSKRQTLKKGDKEIGILSRLKNKKNKCDSPFQSAEVNITAGGVTII